MKIIEYFRQTEEDKLHWCRQIYGFVFLKRMHTVWNEETQVFEKEIR